VLHHHPRRYAAGQRREEAIGNDSVEARETARQYHASAR
jgi:hypothetical protein